MFKKITILFLLFPPVALAGQLALKMATIAPEGTGWMEVWKDAAQEIEARTKGAIDVRTYASGVLGDEGEYVTLLKNGDIDLAGITVHGISLIAPQFLVLSVPFQFRNYSEVDYVLENLDEEFRSIFQKKGYQPLLFIDHGFVYAYSTINIQTPPEIRKARVWIWMDEPSARLIFKAMNVQNFVPVPFQDVVPGLKNGLIDIVYTSPSVCVATMWYRYLNYLISPPLRYEPAVLVAGPSFKQKFSPQQQMLISEIIATKVQEAREIMRREQDNAFVELKKRMKLIRWREEFTSSIRERTLEFMVEKGLADASLLRKVNALLRTFRK